MELFQFVLQFFNTTNMIPLLAIPLVIAIFAVGIFPFSGKNGPAMAMTYAKIGLGPVVLFEFVTRGEFDQYPATYSILGGWLALTWFIALYVKWNYEKEEKQAAAKWNIKHKEN